MIMHFEYPLGGANNGARELKCTSDIVTRAMKKDLGVLRYWLKESQLI